MGFNNYVLPYNKRATLGRRHLKVMIVLASFPKMSSGFYLKTLIKDYGQFDFIILAILFPFLVLPQLQSKYQWIADVKIREVLYFILYMKIFVFSRNIRHKRELPILVFMLLSVGVALNTLLRYGPDMAVRNYLMFMNCAVLAPICARAKLTSKHIKALLLIWLLLICVSSGTLIYQSFGGEIEWLTPAYAAQRAGLTRHHSLMGYVANGQAVAIALPYLLLCFNLFPFQQIVLLFFAAAMFTSLSKAAILGFALSLLLTVRFGSKEPRRIAVKSLLAVFLIIPVVYAFNPSHFGQSSEAWDYVDASRRVLFGNRNTIGDSKIRNTFSGDFAYRSVQTLDTLGKIRDEPYWTPLDYVIGSSLISVNKDAEADSMLLKNEYPAESSLAKLFISGGFVFLLSYLYLVKQTLSWLVKDNFTTPLGRSCAIGFVMACLFTLTNAVIYDPGVAPYIWLLIGASANPRLQYL